MAERLKPTQQPSHGPSSDLAHVVATRRRGRRKERVTVYGSRFDRLVAMIGDRSSRWQASGDGKSNAFDRTVQEMATGVSRRTLMRGLASGLVVAAGGGIVSSAEAKKRKKKGKKQHTPQTPTGESRPQNPPAAKKCPPGTSVAFLSVPADGSAVSTPVLEQGVDYVLRPSGFWGTSNDFLQDAFAAFTFADPFSPRLFDNGVRTGLLLDNELPDIWESYQSNHSYGIVVIGKGKPVSFRLLDTDYSGNGGVVHVDVTCGVKTDRSPGRAFTLPSE